MARHTQTFTLALTAALTAYVLTLGGNYNGLLTAGLRQTSIGIVALLILGWLVLRTARRWVWRSTSLDAAVLLWIAAFAVSLAANSESWRRISIGLWFALAYIGVWYGLNDLLANRALSRATLIDALLIAGVAPLVDGFYQMSGWVSTQLLLMLRGAMAFELPRQNSSFENPNTFATFLIMLIPFALTRALLARGGLRVLLIGYALASGLLLFLTFSRGAWIALVGGLALQGALLLSGRGLIGVDQGRAWWARRSPQIRWALLGVAGLALVVVVAALILLVHSFSVNGRTTSLRTGIYGAAWQLFTEKPLTGSGLFTFGAGLARLQSMPPQPPHSHAHDVPLMVAAELGIVGLAALALTVYAIYAAVHRNRSAAVAHDRLVLAGALAAVVAFSLHQLTDVTAMMPSIALMALVALVVATFPVSAPPVQRRRAWVQGAAVVALWVGLIAAGVWSSFQYARYSASVYYGASSGDVLGAAERLQASVDSDPSLAVTYMQQGYFYGLAANDGNTDALNHAVAAYGRFTALEPSYAIGWANLGVLEWQSGARKVGLFALSQAVELAPNAWPLAYLLGQYREQSAEPDDALDAYRQAVTAQPDVLLLPGWNDSAIRVAAAGEVQPHELGQLLQWIDAGNWDAAGELWSKYRTWRGLPTPTEALIFDTVFALHRDDLKAAADILAEAEQAAATRGDRAWVALGRARLALAGGDHAAAAQSLADARAELTLGPFDVDYDMGVNILYVQYIHTAVPRMFLPQVQYPPVLPSALYFEDMTARLIEH